MRQDNELFRQLLSLHDSIEALKHGDGSLSGASSLCSLADIEEEDTISTPSTDLDRQSHLSAETDTLSVSVDVDVDVDWGIAFVAAPMFLHCRFIEYGCYD